MVGTNANSPIFSCITKVTLLTGAASIQGQLLLFFFLNRAVSIRKRLLFKGGFFLRKYGTHNSATGSCEGIRGLLVKQQQTLVVSGFKKRCVIA